MKSIIILLMSIAFTNPIYAAEKKMTKDLKESHEITDEFSDKIKDVKLVDGSLEVTFSLHAAIYHISKSNPKFAELQTVLEAGKSSNKKIKITSTIPKMEIRDARE